MPSTAAKLPPRAPLWMARDRVKGSIFKVESCGLGPRRGRRAQAQLCIMEDAGALSAFDNERHNIETILAVSREHASETFPGLLASGRLLLRYRLDPGSRRSLILDALEVVKFDVHGQAGCLVGAGLRLGIRQTRGGDGPTPRAS